MHRLLFDLGGQQLGLFFGIHTLGGQVFGLGLGVVTACEPLGGLFLEGAEALFNALAAFDHKTDLGLQPPHFGTGFVQLALRLVHVVARCIVRLANGFQVSLNVAQIGNTRLEFVQRLVGIDLDLGLVGFTLGPLQKPQLVLLERDIGLQRVVTGGNFGLLFELVEVGIQLAQDVFDTGQVFAGV